MYRGKKPVYWSPSSKTALAEAELEYQDNHISPSAYIAFPFDADAVANHDVLSRFPGAAALIWTTTPWTIPANMALAMHADFEYSIVAVPASCTAVTAPYLVVVTDRLDEVARLLGSDGDEGGDAVEVVATFSGSSMRDAGTFCRHPLFPDRKSVVFCAEHVTADSGTGCVVVAAFWSTLCGHASSRLRWVVWRGGWTGLCTRHRGMATKTFLQLRTLAWSRCVLWTTKDGLLRRLATRSWGCRCKLLATRRCWRCDLVHAFAQPVRGAVLTLLVQQQALTDAKALLHTEKFSHRYPYDWRTKQPVIIRATEQWFANVEVGP